VSRRKVIVSSDTIKPSKVWRLILCLRAEKPPLKFHKEIEMDDGRVVSIDFARIRKGDVLSNEQIEFHYIEKMLGREEYERKVSEFERGERAHHPLGIAHQQVCEAIMRECRELGYPVVARTKQKTIEVLTDSQAVVYRSNRANSALGLHRKQVTSLHRDIDESNLSTDEKRQLEASRNYHAMIELSIASGKRTLKAMSTGKLKLSGKD